SRRRAAGGAARRARAAPLGRDALLSPPRRDAVRRSADAAPPRVRTVLRSRPGADRALLRRPLDPARPRTRAVRQTAGAALRPRRETAAAAGGRVTAEGKRACVIGA